MQNLFVFIEPSEVAYISSKPGNMILNRFCIDEDAAFELSGINYLKKSYYYVIVAPLFSEINPVESDTEEKGKEYSFWQYCFILKNFIHINN